MDDLLYEDFIDNYSKDYWIKGDTYPLKEEIEYWGGYWVPEKRMWRVDCTDKDDVVYKALKGLGCDMMPVILDPKCQKIQDALNGKKTC